MQFCESKNVHLNFEKAKVNLLHSRQKLSLKIYEHLIAYRWRKRLNDLIYNTNWISSVDEWIMKKKMKHLYNDQIYLNELNLPEQ